MNTTPANQAPAQDAIKAEEFVIAQGTALQQCTLDQFMAEIHRRFFSTVDISFKDYFVEMQSTRNQFTIPHTKLVEYGVVTSDRSSVIHEKLSSLNLVEGVDYNLQDVLQVRENRTLVARTMRMLMPCKLRHIERSSNVV